jgi:hypothetical protein
MQLIRQALNLAPLRQIKERGSLNLLFKFIKRPNAAYLDSDRRPWATGYKPAIPR